MILLGTSNFPVTRSNFAMYFHKRGNFRERERGIKKRETRNDGNVYFSSNTFLFAGNKVNNVIFL